MNGDQQSQPQPLGRRFRRSAWLFLWALLLCATAFAQPVTLSDVSNARERVSKSKGLTDAEKAEVSAVLEEAAKSLQEEIRWKTQQLGHVRTRAVIQSELTVAHDSANAPIPPPPPEPKSETSQQVEEELARMRRERASRVKLRDELAKLQASLAKREDAIVARKVEIREEFQSIDDELSVLALTSASPQWQEASRMALKARRQALQQELDSLGTEGEAVLLRRQLIPIQREIYLMRLEADDRYLASLDLRRSKARTLDAKNSLEGATKEAKSLAQGFPQLAPIEAEIISRATQLWGPNGIEARSDKVATQMDQMRTSLARVNEITASTVRRYDNAGLFSPASEWWPPRVERYGKPAEVGVMVLGFAAAAAVARRDSFRMEEERNAAPAFETQIQQVVDSSGLKPSDAKFERFKANARSLLQLRRNIRNEFLTSARAFSNRLDEAHRTGEDLLKAILELQSFVLQRVLWARSVSGSIIPSLNDIGNAIRWFYSPSDWLEIYESFISSTPRAIAWVLGFVAVITLFILRNRLREILRRPKWNELGSGRTSKLVASIVVSLLVSLPAPLILAYVGWVIGVAGANSELGRGISAGCNHASRFLYLWLILKQLLQNGRAVERLMGWRPEVRASLESAIRTLCYIVTPLLFVAATLAAEGMYFHSDPLLQANNNSLGRMCFLIAVVSVLVVGLRVLRANGAVASALGEGYDARGFERGRMARMILIACLMLAVVLALTGFYITAYLIVRNAVQTAAFTVMLMLVHGVGKQWRLDREESIKSPVRTPVEEEQIRLADAQVRRLSRFALTLIWLGGFLVIWSAAVPALSLLSRVQLAPEFRLVPDVAPEVVKKAAAATPETKPAEKNYEAPAKLPMSPLPATPKADAAPAGAPSEEPGAALFLTDVLLAIFIGVLTAMLVANIPGLLRFTVFRRVRLDKGGEYAVDTIMRYFVIVVGVLIVSGILGVNWSKVQWLAAALTFGVGFGLQEIFANFAAGLILLLDRSIRVGDVVSVGDLSGIVSRIQMRATTVTLWDRSDMVVPNKEFITAKLVNWTLSNPETRVDLKVGVAYASDVEQVREILLRIAKEHPAVMPNPEPQVLLTQFADSAILFELRVFGLYSYGRPVLLDELFRAVVREFRKAGISIAFPQLDVHLKPPPAQTL